MAQASQMIIINCTQQAVEAIRAELDAQPESESLLTERKNFHGDAATWIVSATIAAQALPHVLGFIKDYLTIKQASNASEKVTKITVDDDGKSWFAENPTPEIIEQFLAERRARLK